MFLQTNIYIDRLPTVSASDAFTKSASSHHPPISTGLAGLDELLQPNGSALGSQLSSPGGLIRGQVTEVYGPPGVGKTTLAYVSFYGPSPCFCPLVVLIPIHHLYLVVCDTFGLCIHSIQAAASTLHAGKSVVWIGQSLLCALLVSQHSKAFG